MGTEILSIFILAPIIVGLVDLIKIVKNKNRLKHAILLVSAINLICYFSLDSYFSGFNPMQGVIIGCLFYIPSYLILYGLLTAYFNKINRV
jgi:Ca2+/Na+ antiporter